MSDTTHSDHPQGLDPDIPEESTTNQDIYQMGALLPHATQQQQLSNAALRSGAAEGKAEQSGRARRLGAEPVVQRARRRLAEQQQQRGCERARRTHARGSWGAAAGVDPGDRLRCRIP